MVVCVPWCLSCLFTIETQNYVSNFYIPPQNDIRKYIHYRRHNPIRCSNPNDIDRRDHSIISQIQM